MELQELVKLVESEEISKLYVSGTLGSYYIAITKKGKKLTLHNVEFLEGEKGVNREFKSIDDAYQLTRTHLHHHQFTVF
tara:strand:+ start:1050 stop:1286 length:237 start_codon:yes stop_codon:yes gene_type:complete